MDSREHIVEFDKYCEHCIYKDHPDDVTPCHECLTEPVNTDSRKPVFFEGTKEFKRKEKCRNERLRLESKSRMKTINLNKVK